jgi:hypothetical protein
MNPLDAPNYPILTALNLHPLHRRKGVLVQRSEVLEALRDLGLDVVHRLPKARLIDAGEVERLMAAAGFSRSFIERAFGNSRPWATTPPDLKAILGAFKDILDHFEANHGNVKLPKKKPPPRELIAEAYIGEVESRIRRATLDMHYLTRMDHKVARTALKCFGRPELAAIWLTTPLKQLWNKAPTECRIEDVLQVLGRMENGVFA